MQTEETYSIAVALFDFLPVLATGAGAWFLAGAIGRRLPALSTVAHVAAIAIPLGGAFKASWKLLIAAAQVNLPVLANLLFILMAPGFAALAFSLHHARGAMRSASASATVSAPRLGLWLAVVMVPALLASVLSPGRAWFFWLLGATIVGSAALAGQAIATARLLKLDWKVSGAFAYNFAATFALGGLSRLPPGEATAWIQESLNMSAQLAFVYGAWRLSREMEIR